MNKNGSLAISDLDRCYRPYNFNLSKSRSISITVKIPTSEVLVGNFDCRESKSLILEREKY